MGSQLGGGVTVGSIVGSKVGTGVVEGVRVDGLNVGSYEGSNEIDGLTVG